MIELWEKLMDFARREEIVVNLHEGPSVMGFEGTSTPCAPWRINLYDVKRRTTEEKVYTLAHELGHIIDNRKRGYDFKYELAKMLLADGEQLDQRMRQVILDREKAATDYGRELLREMGLNDFNSYDYDAVENISLYTRLFEQQKKHAEVLEAVLS